jgi:hypothetical protein
MMKRPAISRIRYVDAASEVIDGVAVPAAAARLDLAKPIKCVGKENAGAWGSPFC